MARFDVVHGGLRGEHVTRGMRVEVKEAVALVAEEVMATGWPAACDADGLREFEGSLESGVVGWCDSLDSKTDAEDDEGGLELVVGIFLARGGKEGVDVHVAIVVSCVNPDAGFVIFVRERSAFKSAAGSLAACRQQTYLMHLAVALGPNHSPGYLPHA